MNLSNDKRSPVGQQTAEAGHFRDVAQTASANSFADFDDDTVELTHKGYAQIVDGMAKSIVRLEREAEELRAGAALAEAERIEMAKMLRSEREAHAVCQNERDEARVQYRSTEALAMALVKTIDELRTEKADLFVKLVNLQAGSRRATLGEIEESVREKYEPEYEREGMEN